MTKTQRLLGAIACAVALGACGQQPPLSPEHSKLRDHLREQVYTPLDMAQPYVPEGKLMDYRTWYPTPAVGPTTPAPRADGKCPYYVAVMDHTPDCAYAKQAIENLKDTP